MKRYTLSTPKRECMVSLDALVDEAVREMGVTEGVCCVFVPHTTAAVTINENADPDVQRDILSHLAKLMPLEAGYRHSEGNSDAHIKSVLTGQSVLLPISGGRVQRGTWQSVFFCEFDGPRAREVWISVVGSR
jgi:secondary thiamine-phosphate synthase enzyme